MSDIENNLLDADSPPSTLDISAAPQFSAYDRERASVLDANGFPIDDDDAPAVVDEPAKTATEAKVEPEKPAAKPAEAVVEPAAAKEPAAAQQSDAPAQSEAFVPQYTAAAAPENADARIKELLTEKRAARKLLFEGDSSMTSEQFDAIEDRVDAEIEAIKDAKTEARLFAKQNEQGQEAVARNEWDRQQAAAFPRFKADGVDYATDTDALMVFNGFMKTLGAQAVASNSNRDAKWFFDEAHKMTKAYYAASKPPAPVAAPPKARGIDRSQLPPTLSGAPVAATSSIEGSKFAHLERMTYAQRERAVARMTKEEYNEYAFGDE